MLPKAIEDLSDKFQYFDGIGKRSSQKLSLELLELDVSKYHELLDSLKQAREEITFCKQCGFFASKKSSTGLCEICQEDSRNNHQLCILEKPTDVLTIEKSQIFRGKYHVLGNLISPLDNIFAENTTISKLVGSRIPRLLKNNKELEIIIFFRSGFSAEATTAYIKDVLKEKGLIDRIKITKLAQGLPLYYNPDTLDQATMIQALEDRREV